MVNRKSSLLAIVAATLSSRGSRSTSHRRRTQRRERTIRVLASRSANLRPGGQPFCGPAFCERLGSGRRGLNT